MYSIIFKACESLNSNVDDHVRERTSIFTILMHIGEIIGKYVYWRINAREETTEFV